MPVLDKKAYAGDRDPKPDPECSYGIAQADCVPVFHLGIMRLRERPDQARRRSQTEVTT
jgi:hypothetical protein